MVVRMTQDEKLEWLACAESPLYFVHNHLHIYDATQRAWIPFKMWPEQAQTLKDFQDNRLVVVLKARQLGLSWLTLGFILWLMLFRPVSAILLFSRRDDESRYLLGDERMKGMYNRLPLWMQARAVVKDNGHEWQLSNGSIARAFPTTAGDSYTATLVFADEADLIPDLSRLLNAVKPTIDGGGRLILLSRSDNAKPDSEFKRIYRAAKRGENGWKAIFLPWYVRPDRTQAWYEAQKADIQSRSGGTLDDLYQQYPATDVEALSPRQANKRIAAQWLRACFREMDPLKVDHKDFDGKQIPAPPAIAGLEIYALPQPDTEYVIGGDPAEGNPTSDDSALTVLNRITGEEVAALSGLYEPSTFAAHIHNIGMWYNKAGVMVERNNHGHSVLLWLRDNSTLQRLPGHDGKPGWHSTSLGKALLYDGAANAFRDQDAILHSFRTFTQLASIEGSTLLAPEGEHDDRSDSWCLAHQARLIQPGRVEVSSNPFF